MNSNFTFPTPNSQDVALVRLGRWKLGVGNCAIAIALCGTVASAHHSLAGMYDQSRRLTLDGIVVQFHNVNPHPYVLMDVKDPNGRTQQWRLEMDNRRELADIGVRDDTLKQGDRLVVSGSPGRSDPRALYVWKLDRPADGLEYEQIGGTPRIRVPSR